MVLSLHACGGGSGGSNSNVQEDYTGTYQVVLGANEPRFQIDIVQTGTDVTFILEGTNLYLSGTGTVSGSVMDLEADLGSLDKFYTTITFSDDALTFTGDFDVTGLNPVQGTITGSFDAWAIYDYDTFGAPQFVVEHNIEQDKIEKLSKFRSGIGHDFSDDFESCRSMKHYFWPKDTVDISTIKIYSPVDGVVMGTSEEWDGTLWKGTAVGIKPDNYAAFHITLFHINLSQALQVGDRVVAGQELGTSQKISGTASDFSLAVNTPAGFRLISYFYVMSDALFLDYQARGMNLMSDGIILKSERDTDPLTCTGQEFADGGSLDNWVVLN
jgi:hypothetical protein